MSAPATFKARVGQRREFLSQSDALAYERGFALFKRGADLSMAPPSPEQTGWADAEFEALEKMAEAWGALA